MVCWCGCNTSSSVPFVPWCANLNSSCRVTLLSKVLAHPERSLVSRWSTVYRPLCTKSNLQLHRRLTPPPPLSPARRYHEAEERRREQETHIAALEKKLLDASRLAEKHEVDVQAVSLLLVLYLLSSSAPRHTAAKVMLISTLPHSQLGLAPDSRARGSPIAVVGCQAYSCSQRPAAGADQARSARAPGRHGSPRAGTLEYCPEYGR